MATIICKYCGEKKIVPECRVWIEHCSRRCYNESLRLDPKEMARLSKMYHGCRTEVAEILGLKYGTFYGRLQKDGLNHLFKKRGGWW